MNNLTKALKEKSNEELLRYAAMWPTTLESELASRLANALAELETLKTPDPDEINITWHVEDVYMVAEMENLEAPTVEQAREVLRRAEDNHDATFGINWGTLAHHLEEVLEEAGGTEEV